MGRIKNPNKMKRLIFGLLPMVLLTLSSCDKDDDNMKTDPYPVHNPDQAEVVMVDRFSDEAGVLFQRSGNNQLPAANAPINFDMAPFITKGLGPGGELVEYYNFDVQPLNPIPIYVLFRQGEDMPLEGQLNIINAVPGDAGYSDFWHVMKVTVPADYKANSATSFDDISARGFDVEATTLIVNCPVVPEGSSASKRMGGAPSGLVRGWYKDKVVFYFDFSEKMLERTSNGQVPVSPIYVTFNKNPDMNDPSSGPASGFVTESGTDQTHNVIATLPSHSTYSPLWMVNIYDNMDFANVSDLNSALMANILVNGAANVNCPVVSVQ